MKGFDLAVQPFLEAVDVASSVIEKFASEDARYGITFSKKKGTRLLAVSGNATVNITLDSCVTLHDGEFAFAFDPTVIRQVLNRRVKLEVEYTKTNQFKFFSRSKGGSYGGEIVTQEFVPDAMSGANRRTVGSEKGKKLELDKAAVSEILRAIKLTSIAAVHSADEINSLIRIVDGNVHVAATDNYHMAIYRGSAKHKGLSSMQLALPAAYFQLFARAAALSFAEEERPALILNGSKSVTFSSKSYELTLPAIQVEKAMFDQVFSKFDEVLSAKPSVIFDVEHSKVNDAINNLSAIYEQGAVIKLGVTKAEKDKAKIQFKTESAYGKLSDSVTVANFKTTKFDSASLDPKTFMDSMRLMDSVIRLSILANPNVFLIEQRLDDGKVNHLGLLI